ncbi:hypothetical protein M5K25_013274 [Dendrobium thyrsiflorum]|uniref:Uncharacterized protein n=1 Tax=Dendrobium thyrsiflorum TaxID=117978 RepID=A0ABD0UTD6_DENTH
MDIGANIGGCIVLVEVSGIQVVAAACGFYVILDGDYDGGTCGEGDRLEVEVFDCFEGDISIPAYEKNFCYFVVCCSVYFLWKERNERRFNAAVSPIQTTVRKISHAIHAKTSSWKYIEALQTSFPSCFRDF